MAGIYTGLPSGSGAESPSHSRHRHLTLKKNTGVEPTKLLWLMMLHVSCVRLVCDTREPRLYSSLALSISGCVRSKICLA